MKEESLELVEIVEEAFSHFEYGTEVLTYPDDGQCGDMTVEEIELGRATIAYLGTRLLLMSRMQQSGAYESNAGWVAMRKFQAEIYRELADMLGIKGAEKDRVAEVKRLYSVSSGRQNEDEDYCGKIDGFMQDFEEKYGLMTENLPVIFI